MQRIVDGILFEGKHVEDCFDVRTWRCNGVMERSVRQVVEWSEIGPCPPLDEIHPERDAEWLEEKREKSVRKAAGRAKTQCRRFIVSEGFNELLTLTYKENQQDRDLCKKHFKEWVRRMRMALGKDEVFLDAQGKRRTRRVPADFRYCASFERQDRGAMHVHIACHKLPEHGSHRGAKVVAWRLGTVVWRAIVGEGNGLCFVGGKTRYGAPRASRMGLAKMAAYVSKYILKDYADVPVGANRYSRSDGGRKVEVEVVRLSGSLAEVIAVCFELGEGGCIVSHRMSRFRDGWWLSTDLAAPRHQFGG